MDRKAPDLELTDEEQLEIGNSRNFQYKDEREQRLRTIIAKLSTYIEEYGEYVSEWNRSVLEANSYSSWENGDGS